jgi:hypothetical protein
MLVLCIARHPYLSEHLSRFFQGLGVDTVPGVGIDDLMGRMASCEPDAVICEYELLSSLSLDLWETDPRLSRIPLIAISFSRHPGQAHLSEISGVAGFLYLPTLRPEAAQRILAAVWRQRVGVASNEPTLTHGSWPAPTLPTPTQ